MTDSSDSSGTEIEKFATTIGLYALGEISLGKAAERAGVTRWEMTEILSERGVDIRLGPQRMQDLEEEIDVALDIDWANQFRNWCFSPYRTRGHSSEDRDEQPDDVTAEGVATTRVAYLTEKNRLLSDRISELEDTLEQKTEHIEELEADNRTLRNQLTTYEEQLESADQESDLETDAGAASSEGRESIWNRAKRFVGEEKE